MASRQLRDRAFPLGVAFALITVAGLTADTASLSLILAMGGGGSLLRMFPLSGVAVAISALLLVPSVDRRPRLATLRSVGIGIGGLYLASLALAVAAPNSELALVGVGLAWIVAAAHKYVYPMLLWSLAGDLFNVAEARTINGWIASWSYAGRLAAFGLALCTPIALRAVGLPLVWLLAPSALITLGAALWLPHRLQDSGASPGIPGGQTVRESVVGGVKFVHEVRVWRWFVAGAIMTATATAGVSIGIGSTAGRILGSDAGLLQMYLAGAQVTAALLCLGVQRWLADPITRRVGIQGTLLALPLGVILSALALAAGIIMGNLWLVALAVVAWRVPEWSLDQNARSAALGFVPDQRRARVSLILVLAVTAGWVLSPIVAGPGLWTHWAWLSGALPAAVGIAALGWWLAVYRGWNASLLDWRLRRRKRGGFAWEDLDAL